MEYTVKQMAKLFDVSEHTLRYYTDLELLPCMRDSNNRRVFNEESVNWMQGIQCLRGCGFTMEQIGRYCALCRREESADNLQARYQMILQARADAYERLKEAQTAVSYIEEKVRHYEHILSGSVPDDSNPQRWTAESRPEAHR